MQLLMAECNCTEGRHNRFYRLIQKEVITLEEQTLNTRQQLLSSEELFGTARTAYLVAYNYNNSLA
jgi:hypothetical protein